LLWLVANRIYNSALGRTLRAIREDVDVAEALGKNAFKFQLIALGIGCFYAGVGGALTIEFITAFNPNAFQAPETFVIWAALLVGGRANNWGAMLGSFVVPVLLFEGTRFIPVPQSAGILVGGIRFMVVGVALMLILWFRPEGILPERRTFYELPVGFRLSK
jgi:ABC-type branched-subunit amino acid transport system permease subunit